jgi:predicted esterase
MAIIIATTSIQLAPNQSIAYFFAHGLGGTGHQKGYCASNKIFLPHYPCYAYHGPEVAHGRGPIDNSKVSLGQADDIAALKDGLKAMPNGNAVQTLIGFGISKGAATWINAAAVLKPANLKALILESPFADANEVAYDIGKKFGLGYVPYGESTAVLAIETLHEKYNPNGPQPITSIQQVPNIPIILIHSRADKLIPINHSRKLYRELIKGGRNNVYLVEIEHGNHARIFEENDYQGLLSYLAPVHAFYKQYNFPYDQELANMVTLSKYQPSLQEITKKIDADEQSETFKRRIKLGCAVTAAGLAYAYKTMSSETSSK